MIRLSWEPKGKFKGGGSKLGGIVSGGRDKQSSRDRPFNFNHFTLQQHLSASTFAISTTNELNRVLSVITIQVYTRLQSTP